MREAALVLVAVAVCSASVLEFVTLPKTISISSTNRELRLSEVPLLNENLLGLSAKPVSGFEVNGDLFTRPHAIALFRVEGIDSLDGDKYQKYQLQTDRYDPSLLDEELANVFGADREIVTVNREGSSGSVIAKTAAKQQINEEDFKTKVPALRQELENVYRLAATIASQGAKLGEKNAADVYRVTISGLAGITNAEDRKAALKDVQNAIDKLTKALTTAYGDQVIVEVLALSEPVKSTSHHEEQTLIRRKRAADMSETDKNLTTWRESLNVYVFTSTDYPAMFAIFAGLVIALVLAVLYTVVGMMSMDPSKDSIIYRMTTTRMKKA